MPTWATYRYKVLPRSCRKVVRWSISRGGCRFAPGHAGDCKPGKGRAWRPAKA